MDALGNKDIFAKNLRKYIEKSGKDRKMVCDDLGFKYTTFADWYNGKKYPRIDKIEMLAKYFGILKSDLIEDHTVPNELPYTPNKRIPVLGRISAGLPLYAEQHIEGYTTIELPNDGEYFALLAHGDSMDAIGIRDGYTLVVRRQDDVENGEVAVVLVDGQDATVKRFYRDGNRVTLMPQSHNPAHMPQIYDASRIDIRIQGKVVKVMFNL